MAHPLRRMAALTAAGLLAHAAPAFGQGVHVEIQLPPHFERKIERAVATSMAVAAEAVERALHSMPRHGDIRIDVGMRDAREQNRDFRAQRSDRISRTLALGATGLLDLRNVSGHIVVNAGSGRDVVLEIEKRVRGRRDADAATGLDEVDVSIDHRGERAIVETVYPRGRGRRDYDVSTDYTVTAPRGTRLVIRSTSGDVTVRGIMGDTSVELISGNITINQGGRISQARSISGVVRLTDIDTDGTVSAASVSGDVLLQRIRARRLTAESMSSTVRAEDSACDGVQLKSLSGTVEYIGQLARNGRYELESHSGTVRLVTSRNAGFELQARSFSGRIRPEGLSLDAVSMDRGQLRATVGDGSAIVIANTFSGDVVVARK